MTTNRLAKSEGSGRRKLTPYEIAAQGNAAIAQAGRTDIEWVVRDNQAVIQWRAQRMIEQPYRADLA